MKVIALRGETNCGKTTTLCKVRDFMLAEGFREIELVKDLWNTDFLSIFEYRGTRIGIVSQGDYAISNSSSKNISVKDHLKNLENKGCKVSICACTKGKPRIQDAIDAYKDHTYVDKDKTPSFACPNRANEVYARFLIEKLKEKMP